MRRSATSASASEATLMFLWWARNGSSFAKCLGAQCEAELETAGKKPNISSCASLAICVSPCSPVQASARSAIISGM
eukprot:5332848-Amphidinium_carterae.1